MLYLGGNKCLKMVNGGPDDGLMWSEAVRECRRGPGFMPDIASIHDLKETGEEIFMFSESTTILFQFHRIYYRVVDIAVKAIC